MGKGTYILGISAFYSDSAAALVRDGEIIAAAQEERFTRKKHDGSFPERSVEYCLAEGGITISEVDIVAFHGKRLRHPAERYIRETLNYTGRIQFLRHHHSHAASAFYPSPFKEAAILTMDDTVGRVSTCFGSGDGEKMRIHSGIGSPHSLGLLYSAFTYYCGFNAGSDEYVLMGLAPCGEPEYVDVILDKLIHLRNDGMFRLNKRYFDGRGIHSLPNRRFDDLFGGPRRDPACGLEKKHLDLARSVQAVTEKALKNLVERLYRDTGSRNLCLSGESALNCVANGKVLLEGPFKRIWVQPASSDAGGALGAALLAYHGYLGGCRRINNEGDGQKGSFLGPSFREDEIEAFLEGKGIPHERLSRAELLKSVSDLIAGQKVVGWFQGRMEFGPRALGSRSILADARFKDTQSIINDKIKFRESFRPFAPSIMLEKADEYFDHKGESPYMLFAVPLKEDKKENVKAGARLKGMEKLKIKRSVIPAVTHVDYSARVQTVKRSDSPLFYDLLNRFYEDNGCPVIVNTSFNVKGEPIVCTPEDAYRCFMKTDMDCLVMGPFLVRKEQGNTVYAKEGKRTCEYC